MVTFRGGVPQTPKEACQELVGGDWHEKVIMNTYFGPFFRSLLDVPFTPLGFFRVFEKFSKFFQPPKGEKNFLPKVP